MRTTVVTEPQAQDAPVLEKLSTLDRLLPLWIGAAMALGIAAGKLFPGLDDTLDRIKIDTVSLPIAIGLLLMMYPVLAKVRYSPWPSASSASPPARPSPVSSAR